MLGSFERVKALQKYSLSLHERDLQNPQVISDIESPTGKASVAPDMACPQSNVAGTGSFTPLYAFLLYRMWENKGVYFVCYIYLYVYNDFNVLICNWMATI